MTPAQLSEITERSEHCRMVFQPPIEMIGKAVRCDIPALLVHISELSTENKKLIETGERLTSGNKQLIEKIGQLELTAKAVIISSYDAVSNQYIINNREAFETLQKLVREEIPK